MVKNGRLKRIPATNLALLLIEVCGRNRDWQSSEIRNEVAKGLGELKTSPGAAQLTVLTYFEFASQEETLPHIRYVLADKNLATPIVLISLSRFSDLILAKESDLTQGKDGALVRERINDFKQRIIK